MKITYTFGVKNIIKTGVKIYKLPSDIIEKIKEKCNKDDICNLLPIKSGDKVKIINNKSPSLIGIFLNILMKKGLLFFRASKIKAKVKVFNNSIETLV